MSRDETDARERAVIEDVGLLDMCLQALVYERTGRYDPGDENDPTEP